ncbi:Hsp70 family protein [Thermosynechococcaceae cyanobacterium BACA0444]|uniref:Hsp70 family protein n=1 Tax=Pseudocalidococcus azoricus BACA0444 TaxID=2918990 RepID=A0AAE4JXJ3_9CYAN|nr:Hsp70 family protein [Pseudocalidococcus azoricus]MDS3859979.1 Hsp70 family protein [Pseudocalidococcus azoricus BACA0444]
MSYALDFGTSNTVIARWNPISQQPEPVILPGLTESLDSPLIPSLLYVDQAQIPQLTLGQQVILNELNHGNNQRVFRNFKRGIGAEIQGFLPKLDGCDLTFEQIGTWFIEHLYQQLLKLHPDALKSLVLTVPVDCFAAYRLWLTELCQALNVEQVKLLDEPTAAALGTGLGDAQTLLVIDFGGGTLDLSLVQQPQTPPESRGFLLKWGQQILGQKEQPSPSSQIAKVISKAGRTLGGSDIDQWIGAYFQAQDNLPITPWTLRLWERLKIKLSSQAKAEEFYRNPDTGQEHQITLTRPELEQILATHDFFSRLDDCLTQVLHQARGQGITTKDIEGVILIGGTCQMPAIKAWIRSHFPTHKIAADHPLTAVATGALYLDQGAGIADFLYHGYGIRYWDYRRQTHHWHPIIQPGQSYPMSQPIELILGASTADQPGLELIMGELGQTQERTEIFFEGGQLITRTIKDQPTVQALNDREGSRTIAQLNPLGQPGTDRLKVLFFVDQHRQLRISIDDLLTQTRLVDQQLVITLR